MPRSPLGVYKNQARAEKRRVFFTGNGAVTRGYGVCYDRDYGTATANDPLRDKRVNTPDNTNNNSFAGVAVMSYPAVTGGQWIEIYEPGSVCEIYIDGSKTIGENTFATCQIGGGGSGTFNATYPGFRGKGTAKIMQTITGAGYVLAELDGWGESGLVETIQAVDNTAVPMMLGGVTLITGAITIGAGDSTATLADGTYQGMQKRILLIGALTTNDYQVTVTHGEQFDGTTDLAGLEFDGAADESSLEWRGSKWRLTQNAGPTIS